MRKDYDQRIAELEEAKLEAENTVKSTSAQLGESQKQYQETSRQLETKVKELATLRKENSKRKQDYENTIAN